MVLGCILCKEPLVTPKNFKVKKQKYLRGRPKNPQADGQDGNKVNQIQEAEIVLSKCGHLFHRNCLKTYMTNHSPGAPMKRECPFCYKPIALSQCIQVFPNVDSNDALTEKLKAIHASNDELHQTITELKKELVDKTEVLRSLKSDVEMFREKLKIQKFEVDKLVRPAEPMQVLRDRLTAKENYVQSLTDQNKKLVELIEQQAIRIQRKNNNPNATEEELKQPADESKDEGPCAIANLDLSKFEQEFSEDCSSLASLCDKYRNKLPPYFRSSTSPKISVQTIDEDEEEESEEDSQIDLSIKNKGQRLSWEESHDFDFDTRSLSPRMARPIPKRVKYLESRERKLAGDANDCARRSNLDYDLELELSATAMTNSASIITPAERIRKLVECTRKKNLKKIAKNPKRIVK